MSPPEGREVCSRGVSVSTSHDRVPMTCGALDPILHLLRLHHEAHVRARRKGKSKHTL